MARLRVTATVTATAVAGLSVAALAWGAPSPTTTTSDAKSDVAQAPDIQRVSVSRAGDGRLRAVISFFDPVKASDLEASSGPPGSVCLRVWTARKPDPAAQRPDRLVCVTARSEDELRASVLRQEGKGLPRRTGSASVQRNSSERSIIVRVSQSALGRPERIRFAAEATRAGCAEPSCIDTAPDAPSTRAFRLR